MSYVFLPSRNSVWSSARYRSASAAEGSSNSVMIRGIASRLRTMCSSASTPREKGLGDSFSSGFVFPLEVVSIVGFDGLGSASGEDGKEDGKEEVEDGSAGGCKGLYFAYIWSRLILGSGTMAPFSKRDSRYVEALYAIRMRTLLAKRLIKRRERRAAHLYSDATISKRRRKKVNWV